MQQAAILVPQQAISRDTRGVPSVWVVKADNTVEAREVQTLRTVGNAWLISKGVSEGERIVTEGVQRVRSGIAVNAVEAKNVDLVADFAATTEASAN
ncbi:Solvent efflux pump periplasmic linker SrpA precursor [compost metagenome]